MTHTNCIVCGEDHGSDRKISWDGQGINSCGIYRDRIAKFRPEYILLGNNYVNAITSHDALVAALEAMVNVTDGCMSDHEAKDIGLIGALNQARAALKLAKGE